MASPIQAILTAFSMAYREKSQKVVALVTSYLADGYSVSDAVDKAMQVAAVSSFLTNAVEDAIRKAAAVGADVQSIPLLPELKEAWAPSGMKLSEKLHGAEKEMRQSIVSTIKAQQKLGTHALQTARALYDGYRAGHVVRQQQLPQYLDVIASFARKSDLTKADQQALQRLVRKAKRQVDRIGANGAPDKSLQTAYRQLLNAVDENNAKAIENAVRTAVEEKSRYVAERIARTEAARAWADGFHNKYDGDTEVAAYRWQLSSRHPHYDICDMYAHANLWGLGPGIFPKDKTPTLPVHPHCLCHLSLVYVTELDGKQAKDNIKAGGDRYLKQQSHLKRCQLMGIEGARSWEHGKADWRQFMRNWSNTTARIRLPEFLKNGKMKTEICTNKQLEYLDDGIKSFIPLHALVEPKKIIAGLSTGSHLRIAKKLSDEHGGNEKGWQKIVGTITSEKYIFDIHWYYHKDIRNVNFKIKSYKGRG